MANDNMDYINGKVDAYREIHVFVSKLAIELFERGNDKDAELLSQIAYECKERKNEAIIVVRRIKSRPMQHSAIETENLRRVRVLEGLGRSVDAGQIGGSNDGENER